MSQKKGHIKRIGLVLSLAPGYSETFFRNKIKGLQDHGFEVILFVDGLSSRDSVVSCPIIAAPNFSQGHIRFVGSLFRSLFTMLFVNPKRSLKLFKLNKGDGFSFNKNLKTVLLNQHFLNQELDWLHFGFGILAKDRENIAAVLKAKMGVSFRGFDLYLSPLKHPHCYDLLFLKEVNYHVLAEEMKQVLIDQGVRKEKVAVITPAIDVNFFKSSLTGSSLNKKPLCLTTVARLHWKKGLEYTLEAMAFLKAQGVDFHYTIVGTGDQYERLVFAVHQLGLKNQVSFAGKLSPEDVKKIYETTDVYIQYSIQEGFCNAVLEAQAMGLLCVVSNAEGLSENVLHEQTGWVVPKRQPQALAECILAIMNMPTTSLDQIRIHASERVKTNFYLKKQQEQFVDFYEKS